MDLKITDIFIKYLSLQERTQRDIFCILFIISLIIWGVKKIYPIYEKKYLSKNLQPFFSPQNVFSATRYYIETKYQNVDPSEDDEPGKYYIATAKNKLIPLFIEK